MVSGDTFSEGFSRTRPVLTDVTSRHRPGKRAFSLISSDSPGKSEDGDSQFAKQVCLGVENLVKEKCQLQFSHRNMLLLRPKGKHPCVKLPLCGLQNANVSSHNLLDGVAVQIATDSCTSGVPTPTCSRTTLPITEGFVDHASENDDDRDLCVDKLASPKCGAGEQRATIFSSRDSKFKGLERCAGLKGDGGANSVFWGGDFLKDCFCSFCSTAAYIWSDLHYQDVKGRLSVLKKSQKEASFVAQKISEAKDTAIPDQQNSTDLSKLELYLMDQWKSLFVHMDNTFAHESNRLESSFETVKNLRENCKNDLELIGNGHFNNY